MFRVQCKKCHQRLLIMKESDLDMKHFEDINGNLCGGDLELITEVKPGV